MYFLTKVSDALKQLIDNPEDLSTLPQLVEQVAQMEEQEADYQNRISTLQDINRSYLQQIPIPNKDEPKEEPKEEKVTLEDAQTQIMKSLGVSE